MVKASKPTDKKVGGRGLTVKLKNARGRRVSSQRWLQRQLNDPYVVRAKQMGYRSRAAFKLVEINEKHQFLKPGAYVIDLGAAPGGWSQVAKESVKNGRVIALDIQPMEAITGVDILEQDFMAAEAPQKILDLLDGQKVNVVLSDMAAPATGHPQTDHLRIMDLAEAAFDFAEQVLAPGGTFVAKVLQGGTEAALLTKLKTHFKTVKHIKPPASRKDSAETYVIGLEFKS
jgi:23S rRNA (uridine2552-2'-O)-methyltransferase